MHDMAWLDWFWLRGGEGKGEIREGKGRLYERREEQTQEQKQK
jgi:hypothetical protein